MRQLLAHVNVEGGTRDPPQLGDKKLVIALLLRMIDEGVYLKYSHPAKGVYVLCT